jgi:hypothetical protein
MSIAGAQAEVRLLGVLTSTFPDTKTNIASSGKTTNSF